MPGTAIAYAARCLRDVRYCSSVCCYAPTLCYAMSGTVIAYGTVRRLVLTRTTLRMSGTELGYGGTASLREIRY
eukprot:1495402-Rhodomonas_salina.1